MITYIYAPAEWGLLAKSWLKALKSDNNSENTIRIYLHAVRLLGEWAYRLDEPMEPTTITKHEIREYMSELIERTSASNAHEPGRGGRRRRHFATHLTNEGPSGSTRSSA